MFRYELLCDALDRAIANGRLPTDEAQALEWVCEHPVLVQGSAANIEITSADDLVLAAAFLNARENATVHTLRVFVYENRISYVAYTHLAPATLSCSAASHSSLARHHRPLRRRRHLRALCDALLGAAS